MRRGRLANVVFGLEVQRDAAGLGLVRAGLGALDDGRKAQLGRGRGRLVGRLRRSAPARPGSRRPGAARGPGPGAARDRRRRTRPPRSAPRPRAVSTPSSVGTEPAGRRSHSARAAARPSARAADSGYGKLRQRPRVGGRSPSAISEVSTGFPSAPPRPHARLRPRPRRLRRRPAARRARSARRQPGRRARSARPARTSGPSPSRACRPGWRRWPPRAGRRAGLASVSGASAGSSRPAASQASAQRMPSPPAFVITATRLPARQRLRREQGGCVDQLLERPRANHAGLAEERLDRRLGARQRRGV